MLTPRTGTILPQFPCSLEAQRETSNSVEEYWGRLAKVLLRFFEGGVV